MTSQTTYGLYMAKGAPLDGEGFWLIGWRRPTFNGRKIRLAVYSAGHPEERLTWKTETGAAKVAAEQSNDRITWEVRRIS